MLTTDNAEVVRLAKENWGKEYIPVNCVGKEKNQYTILDKAKKDLALGDNTIGEIVNKGQIAKSQLDHLARNKDLYVKKVGLDAYNKQVDGLQDIIDSLTIASNISIDSAKRKYDLDMRAYLKNIDNSKYWLRDEDNKILKPKFFESISQNDKIVTQELDCNMDLVAEFMSKPSRSRENLKDITELLEDYNTKKVNSRQLNEVLELVVGANKKITAYRIQINALENNDDLYKLIDSEKAKLRKALKKYKLNDDTYKCLLNKVYTDKDFSSCKSLMLDSLMEYDTDKFIGSFVKGASVPSQAMLQKLAEDGVIEYLNGNEHLINGIVNSHDESYKQIKEQVNLIHKDYTEGIITLEEAQGKIDKVITDISKTLRVTVTDGMTERFTKVIEFGYCNNLYNFSKEVGLAVSFDSIPKRAIESILEKEFAGGKFKDRLYKNIDGVMADELKGVLKTGFEEGKTIWTMTQEAKEVLGYDVKSCERIVRTETNNFYNQGTLKAYEELGIEKYVFLATLDTRTSKVCASLDLKVFAKDDAEVGKNYPPMHPNCRSTTMMYVDDEWLKSLGRIARNKEGRNINIETMSYQEWYDKFIK